MFAQSLNFIRIILNGTAKTVDKLDKLDIFKSQIFDLTDELVKSDRRGRNGDNQYQFDLVTRCRETNPFSTINLGAFDLNNTLLITIVVSHYSSAKISEWMKSTKQWLSWLTPQVVL